MEFKKNKKQTNKQNTPLEVFVNMSPKIKILAVLKTNVIIWSANHIFYASNQH